MKDRRKDIRAAVRLQMLSVIGGLVETPTTELLRTLAALYVSSPLRWQTFMDDARVLIDGTSENLSGFAETAAPGESEPDD